ncbi:hypothetical protein ACEWY4_023568 [Coilia grayii]|uniref:Fibronectin type-III domain-containing protein n=1 Tax=Coilia grayii TaxID=363190 RepID=A0ABD1J5A0_9TELE
MQFHHLPISEEEDEEEEEEVEEEKGKENYSYDDGSQLCYCEKGYFRADKDPPSMACTRPPSPPRNVVFNINETSLFLEWSPPSDTGGRKDLTYNVLCKRCGPDQQQCELCGGELRFVPRPQGLTNASVTVLDFAAHANYTFEIESQNGVSELSSVPRPVAAVTISTDQGASYSIDRHSLAIFCVFQGHGGRQPGDVRPTRRKGERNALGFSNLLLPCKGHHYRCIMGDDGKEPTCWSGHLAVAALMAPRGMAFFVNVTSQGVGDLHQQGSALLASTVALPVGCMEGDMARTR